MKLMIYKICSFIIIAAVISFLGFSLENLWLIFRKGYIDNRNMNLPFLSGYGVLVLGMYFLFGTPLDIGNDNLTSEQKYLLYFFVSFITVSIGEILLGKTVERFLGIEYWDYSTIPMHITQYTSIPTSIAFALIITQFMSDIFPKLLSFIAEISYNTVLNLGLIASVLLPIDFIISFKEMYYTRKLNVIWTIHIFPKGLPEILNEKKTAFIN